MSCRYIAEWRGDRYEASPALEADRLVIRLYRAEAGEGFDEVRTDRYVRVIPWEGIDALFYRRSVCEWRGEPFIVLDRDESGTLLLEYIGAQQPVVQRLGLDRLERGVFRAQLPEADVTRLAEEDVRLS